MSINEENKTFIMKHTFTDVMNMENGVNHYSEEEKHFNIPWRVVIHLTQSSSIIYVGLSCRKSDGDEQWSIDTSIDAKITTPNGEKSIAINQTYPLGKDKGWSVTKESSKDYLVDGNLTVELHVTIKKVTGIEYPILRNFDDELAKESSDVVLKVKDQKFYVSKLYLVSQSAYFKSLFLGNFDESKQSEVQLKDIDPWNFQKFLEVLFGELIENDDNIEGILQLADMYNAQTVIRQCEQFLFHRSQQDMKFKFNMALKYNMDQLLKKCISEIKSVDDIKEVLPEDDSYINKPIYRQLLKLAIEFHEKK